jgi:hypothetical protein
MSLAGDAGPRVRGFWPPLRENSANDSRLSGTGWHTSAHESGVELGFLRNTLLWTTI